MLKALGFKVLSATSGSKGLKIYKQYVDKIDLVILDLLMPEMNGATCFENLKLINPEVKVIISSGVGEIEKRNQLKKMGISDYLDKPYNLNKLAEKINNIIN